MQKIVLTFGLIAGAILSAMMLATIPFWTGSASTRRRSSATRRW